MRRKRFLLASLAFSLAAQPNNDFFESKIRPVLVTSCYGCHSSKLQSPMGGLVLDTKAGLLKGGSDGSVVVPGKPAQSRLLQALRYSNPNLQMPPTGKLPEQVIGDFEQWIAAGAPDPREDPAAAVTQTPALLKGMPIEEGRKWWAFQPVHVMPAPPVEDASWPKTKIDAFLLAKLEAKGLKPSERVDPRTLVRRIYVDLVGYKPTYEEVEAFANDRSPDTYESLVNRLLASPHYGERWARHWMDVARFGEDNPTSEATNPPYPFAWRYRDWIIEAINKDVPYDRFVKLQLAADLMPGTPRDDLRALGYLGAAPVYHTDLRLSKDVIETLFTDDWDERVDAVSRGLLGLTVACARCHDHKFDPILIKDYYALAGVFASTMAAPRPIAEIDPGTDQKFMYASVRLFYLSYLANLMNNEPGSKPEQAAKESADFTKEMEAVRDSMAYLKTDHPEMWDYLNSLAKAPRPKPAPGAAKPAPATTTAAVTVVDAPKPAANANAQRRRPAASDLPFMQSVFDAGIWINGSNPD